MFKIYIYAARGLNSLPGFEGPAWRAERAEAAPETIEFESLDHDGHGIRAISGGALQKSPARGSD